MNASMRWTRPVRIARAVAAAALTSLVALALPLAAGAMDVVSDQTVTGFKFPESVGCDADARVLYVSQFGSALKPLEKDGQGYIGKVSLTGAVLDEKFLPAGGAPLNKPKGIWIAKGMLWVTDIDVVWQFDLKTRKGRKVGLPGIQFANDPTVLGDTLYVTDNRGDAVYTVTPADFLNRSGEPKVAVAWSGKGVNPNGIYPAQDGSLLLVGFKSNTEARGIWAMRPGQDPKALSQPIGRLDGVYELGNGDLLVTDWDSGALFQWSRQGGKQHLATGFKGPADHCVLPDAGGLLVAVPDLVKSELRLVRLK
jgi:hypothetical protein